MKTSNHLLRKINLSESKDKISRKRTRSKPVSLLLLVFEKKKLVSLNIFE